MICYICLKTNIPVSEITKIVTMALFRQTLTRLTTVTSSTLTRAVPVANYHEKVNSVHEDEILVMFFYVLYNVMLNRRSFVLIYVYLVSHNTNCLDKNHKNVLIVNLQVIDHYENPRNVGKLDPKKMNVGTGLVGAPACGDVMKLQIEVDYITRNVK